MQIEATRRFDGNDDSIPLIKLARALRSNSNLTPNLQVILFRFWTQLMIYRNYKFELLG